MFRLKIIRYGFAFILIAATMVGLNTGLTATSYEDAQITEQELLDTMESSSNEARASTPLLPDALEQRYQSSQPRDTVHEYIVKPVVLVSLGVYADEIATVTYQNQSWMDTWLVRSTLRLLLTAAIVGLIAQQIRRMRALLQNRPGT